MLRLIYLTLLIIFSASTFSTYAISVPKKDIKKDIIEKHKQKYKKEHNKKEIEIDIIQTKKRKAAYSDTQSKPQLAIFLNFTSEYVFRGNSYGIDALNRERKLRCNGCKESLEKPLVSDYTLWFIQPSLHYKSKYKSQLQFLFTLKPTIALQEKKLFTGEGKKYYLPRKKSTVSTLDDLSYSVGLKYYLEEKESLTFSLNTTNYLNSSYTLHSREASNTNDTELLFQYNYLFSLYNQSIGFKLARNIDRIPKKNGKGIYSYLEFYTQKKVMLSNISNFIFNYIYGQSHEDSPLIYANSNIQRDSGGEIKTKKHFRNYMEFNLRFDIKEFYIAWSHVYRISGWEDSSVNIPLVANTFHWLELGLKFIL